MPLFTPIASTDAAKLTGGPVPDAVLPVKVTAGTTAAVGSVTVDAQGRITAITGGGGGGSGTVTSVAMTVPGVLFSVSGSPVTTAGTLALSLLTQTANTILAGPTSGGAATPTMRALVAADIPAVNPSALTGSGTVPLAGLTGITTTQLSASAGIVAAQIASVNPSVLTGSGTVPLAGIPVHAATHEPGGTDPVIHFGAQEFNAAQENIPRWAPSFSNAMTAGTALYMYFTASQNQTVTQISAFCVAATASATLVRLAIFSVGNSSTGIALTNLGQTADVHTTVFIAANTPYTVALDASIASSVALVKGTRYAVGIICVGGTGATLKGQSTTNMFYGNPCLAKTGAAAQTDLPATNTSTVGNTGFLPWVAVS